MRKVLFAAIAVALLAAGQAWAKVHTHVEAKISVDVPKSWKVDLEEDVMVIHDQKQEIAFLLVVLDAKDLDDATKELDEEVGKTVKNLKWDGDAQETKLNGMDAVSVDGKGNVEGTSVDVGVLIVSTPAKKFLLVLGLVQSDKLKAHEKEVERFLKSIRPST